MATAGIEAVFLETHNWGKAAKFFQALGFELEFSTDHNSGQLRNGDGPYVFIAEVPEEQEPGARMVMKVPDADAFRADPVVEVVTPFQDTHHGTREMTVRDPDGRLWSLQAPGRAENGERHGWRDRPDMDPVFTGGFRASVVARARFIEDLVAECAARGTGQYVLLGAGLDTFAQRCRDLASRLRVFEVDQPGTQAWKRQRLVDLGYGVPEWLRLVPVDFEEGASWREEIAKAGFDAARPAVVASTGVSMYLTREANRSALRDLAALAPGSTVAMTFLLPLDLVDERDRQGWVMSENGARSSGTPFMSFFAPEEFLDLARSAGFSDVRHVSGHDLGDRYFAGRPDGLRMSTGEDFIVATT